MSALVHALNLARAAGCFCLLFLFVAVMSTMARAETIRLLAAGSLRAALTEVGNAIEAKSAGAIKVQADFAASGLLRERSEKGEPVHVFASADVGHPTKLWTGGFANSKVAIFARNQLCALAREGLAITTRTLLQTMLDERVRVGISTPKADPSGDYAMTLFAKAEALQPGARAKLESKALRLTGGPDSQKAPAGRNQYGWVMASGKADVFLTYCTNAMLAVKDEPTLQVVQVPPELTVGADYGMIVLKDAPTAATQLAEFILGPDGQAILVKHGFGRGNGAQN
jgi:molybdate transport system substrate-binding protein